MSYEKQTWQTGDVVTSAKLNHMEDGIAGGGGALVVNVTNADDVLTCDKTAGEIVTAFPLVIFLQTGESGTSAAWVSQYSYAPDSGYSIVTTNGDEYLAATENDYPSADNR